jgi:hypothetical protein
VPPQQPAQFVKIVDLALVERPNDLRWLIGFFGLSKPPQRIFAPENVGLS